MPNDQSNFTQPESGGGGYVNAPPGTGANGETWDPVQRRWVPRSEMPAQYDPLAGSHPVDQYGNPAWSDGSTNYEGTQARDATTPGRVEGNSAIDGFNTGGSWGGYTGTMVRGSDGQLRFDGSLSGRAADVDRMRGLGYHAANRQAYQNDYAQAETDALYGAGARQGQDRAIGLARDAALGRNSQAQSLGQRMLQQGAQAQQAAAASTRGGSLAQAAAMRQQQGGQAAYMQQGQTQLDADLADEMAQGRQQYAQAATWQRQQDAEAQRLRQSQATEQMKNEIGQRELNQTGQMGYEGMAQNVNKAAQDAALKNYETAVGIDSAASLRGQRQADRDLQQVGNVASTGGSLVAGLSTMGGSSQTGSTNPNDPRKKRDEEVAYSDVRTKTPMSLGEAAARRMR